MNTIHRYRRHIVVLITLSILAAASGVGVYAGVRYLKRETVNTVNARERIASYERNAKIFADESAALADLQNKVTTMESYIVTPATTPTLLSSIEALAATHAIEFTITSAQTPGKSKDKLIVDFSATGSMKAVSAFLDDLGHQTYQVKMNKLSLFADRTTIKGEWNALGSIQIMSFGL